MMGPRTLNVERTCEANAVPLTLGHIQHPLLPLVIEHVHQRGGVGVRDEHFARALGQLLNTKKNRHTQERK